MVYPVFKVPARNIAVDVDPGKARDWNRENAQESGAVAKDGETKWQDVSHENAGVITKRWLEDFVDP